MELRVYEHSDNSHPMDKILCLEKYTKEDLNNLVGMLGMNNSNNSNSGTNNGM